MSDLSTTSWSETDGNNNQASPLGAPEGMFPSGVNNTMRAMMGATKRFWSRINPTITATNVGNAYTYTGPVVAPTLAHGEVYSFVCPAPNTGAATLNVGVGGAQAIVKHGASGLVALDSSDFATGAVVMAMWDSVGAQFIVVNTPSAGVLETELASLSTVVQTDIHSVSAVIYAAVGGREVPAGSNMFFWNNAAPAGWVFAAADDYTLVTQNIVGDGGGGGGAWAISGLSAETADHTHTFSVTSGNENANHTHTYSGNTGVMLQADVQVGNGANGVSPNGHTHPFSGTTSAESAVHQHAVSGTTSGKSATHTHTGDGTWRPKHLKVIMCTKS